MENYLPLLQSTSLFAGISAGELRPLLSELGACIRSYGRGEALVQAGAPSRRVGVVLTGSIEAYRPAPGGARIPITHMGPGGVFGDVLGGSSLDSPVTVVASAPCEVLLFPYEKLLQPDGSAARQRLLQNLVRTISDKYFLLSRRVDLLVMKTLRAKVCAYLLSEAEQQGSMTFTIPFSRIQLADYLNCDRSALSRELSLMQRDGLLDTYRSSFKLLEPEALRQMILFTVVMADLFHVHPGSPSLCNALLVKHTAPAGGMQGVPGKKVPESTEAPHPGEDEALLYFGNFGTLSPHCGLQAKWGLV